MNIYNEMLNRHKEIIKLIKPEDVLVCEICEKHLCYCFESDLNGSLFICDECYKKHKK